MPEARSAEDLAAEREVFGEFTRALVQTMNRQSYYEETHPSHYAVRGELYEQLVGILVDQPQVSYLLHRGHAQEMFVDGTSLGRVSLVDVMVGGAFEMFVPRLVEYFDRYELVMLAFRRGITRDEFAKFVAVLTRPVMNHDQRFDLQQALVDAGVLNLTVLASSDLGEDADLPWQVRVCLARLRRDLHLLPLYRELDDAGHKRLKLQIFADVVRPLYLADQLKVLVLRAPRIERDLLGVPGLEDMRVVPYLVHALSHRALAELARGLTDEVAAGDVTDPSRLAEARSTVLLCAQRLLAENVRDAEAVLRLLHKKAIIAFEDLPEGLQEWVLAESIAADDDTPAVPAVETARDRRVAVKLGRLAFASGRIPVVVKVVQALRAMQTERPDLVDACEAALTAVIGDAEVRGAVEGLDRQSSRELEPFGQLLAAVGERAASALVAHVVSQGEHARFSSAYHVLDRMPELVAPLVAAALAGPDTDPAVLRVLLTHATHHPSVAVSVVATKLTGHAVPAVRLSALAAVISARLPDAVRLLRVALVDADPEVACLALTALADRFGCAAESHARAVALLTTIDPESDGPLMGVAIQILAAHSPDEASRTAALGALRHVVSEEEYKNGFLGIGYQATAHPEVLAAAAEAMTRLGEQDVGPARTRGSSILDLLTTPIFRK